VVFTGQNNGEVFPLGKTRSDIINALRKKEPHHFKLYGKGWGHGVKEGPSGVYLNAKIGLNIGHYATRLTYSNRVLQIMSNGAMLLCHSAGDIDHVFRDNAVYFKDYGDLLNRIEYYLKHEDERVNIARKGFDFVNSNLTWKHKAIEIVEMIKNYAG
jgi:hypothetical protein